MKSPADWAQRLLKQWQFADHREALLLSEDLWPMSFAIGKPSPSMLTLRTDEVRGHLQRWRGVSVGEVVWEEMSFRAGGEPVKVPVTWKLRDAREWVVATGDEGVLREYERLVRVLGVIDPVFRRVVVRQRNASEEVVRAAEVALRLAPGCAEGRPLRALAVGGVDSKFFERNRGLMVQLLDARFAGLAGELGLEAFLGALDEGDHWLLVAPLETGLLPFGQQRVRASELFEVPLPGTHLLVVENERCLHQLPRLAGTVAVLGSGLHLEWLRAGWLGAKEVAYWGDLDTWGLLMLGRARGYRPGVVPLLMSAEVFQAHAAAGAVVEPSPAGEAAPDGLTGEEKGLYYVLRGAVRGRLEQEFLPAGVVGEAVVRWRERVDAK